MRWIDLLLALAILAVPACAASNGSISGFVLYANNSTVAGASVFINSTNFTGNATSDANGTYSFQSLSYFPGPPTFYDVRATMGNSSTQSVTVALISGNSSRFQNLTFTGQGGPQDGTNGSVSGYVLNATNSTVASAAVFINRTGFIMANTTTDGGGFYSFSNLSYSGVGASVYSIRAQNPANQSSYSGYAAISLAANSYALSQNLSLPPLGGGSPPGDTNGTNGSVSGYVKYGNNSAAYANVSLNGGSGAWALSNQTTGRYQFGNLPWPGGYAVHARGVDLPDFQSPTFDLNMSSSQPLAQNLTLAPGSPPGGGQCGDNNPYSISGYLQAYVNGSLANITGSELFANAMGIDVQSGGGGMFNSSTGAYSINCLQNGSYQVGAGGGGSPGSPPYEYQQQNATINGANVTGLYFILSRMQGGPQGCGGNASIYGYVYGNASNGSLSAISGANVFAGSADTGGGAGSGGPGSGGPGGPGGSFCGGGTNTNGSGFFNITGLTAGSFMLNVMPGEGSSYGEAHLGPDQAITLGNSSSAYGINFTLHRSGFVIGYVFGNASGSLTPVQGAFVNIYSPTPGGAWAGGSTNGSGFFNLSVTPGTGYELNVNPPYGQGYSNYRISPFDPGGAGVNVTAGVATNMGGIVLRQGARIRGYVKNSTGGGLAYVGVNVRPKMMMGPGDGSNMGFGMTNGSGYFEVAGLQENTTYVVEAHPDPQSDYSSGSSEVQLANLATVNITLVTGNLVQGYVKCNGTAVQYSPVSMIKNSAGSNGPDKMMGEMEAGSFAFSMTDGSGHYSARGLSAGNYTLRAELPWNSNSGCSMNTTTISVSGNHEINVTLPLAATLSGYVKDSNGTAIAYAFIDAFIPSPNGGPGMGGPSAFAQSGANGSYTLRLSPNSEQYIVSVRPPWGSNYASAEAQAAIPATGQYSRNFTLGSGGSIRGRLVNSAGTAVQFAFVNAYSENARSFGFSNTMSDGSFTVRGLSPADDFRLFIQPPSTAAGIVPTFVDGVSVTQGGTTDLGAITASTADSALIVSISDNGTAVPSANVHAWLPFTPYFGSCTTDSNGQCNVTGLAAGQYDVFIDSSGRPPVFNSSTVSGNTAFSFDYATSLGSLYTINGTVTNGSGAVAYADVGIWNEQTRFGMHTSSGADGAYTIDGVPAGTYHLGARKAGFFDQMGSITVGADATRNITLSPIASANLFKVDGFVSSLSGSSVATKTVMMVDAANASRFSAFNVTDGSGYYNVYGVPSSGYTITAVLGNLTYGVNATISANATVNITVS